MRLSRGRIVLVVALLAAAVIAGVAVTAARRSHASPASAPAGPDAGLLARANAAVQHAFDVEGRALERFWDSVRPRRIAPSPAPAIAAPVVTTAAPAPVAPTRVATSRP